MQPETQETVVWSDDGLPVSPRFGVVYRGSNPQGDSDAGLEQARHVFLRGCGLLAADGASAWANAPRWQILETGFGLGLNFLATWHAWRADATRPDRLFYSAVEAWPPEAAHILRSAEPFAELAPLAQELAARWHGLLPGVHRMEFEGGKIQLTLAIGDAQAMLSELTGQFDSIYLDGFSPSVNPQMWDIHTMKAIARLARRGALAASWCVVGEMRRRLGTCGFIVKRVPGLPPKRHALRAVYDPRWEPKARADASPLPLPGGATPRRCIVIGSGLAGASCAYSLAQRGWQVTVLDRAAEPAAGASGLPAGVVAPHVSPDDRPLSRLTRAGAQATLGRARWLLREGIEFAPTGVLERHAPGERRLPTPWQEKSDSKATRSTTYSSTAPETITKAQQAAAPLDEARLALWHEQAGWIRPAMLVRSMLKAPGIEWRGNQNVHRLEGSSDADSPVWYVLDESGAMLAEAELVVVSAGFDTRAITGGSLPLNALRGQVAFGPMPGNTSNAALPTFPVNGHGSLIAHVPLQDGAMWVTGSTFERGNPQAQLQDADHAHNRQRIAELLPLAAAAIDSQWPDGRARAWSGVRATLPDRLPAVGALGGKHATTGTNDDAQPCALQLCTGFGARGLTLAVLCGEILASWLHGEPLPVERSLAEKLRAGRLTP
ncbi:FAD-dependent 5-carboxymethylaminomethyl-2-thiouridine(34) oxidoreductase MnmC [Ottowia thiooxydans]|uniref:FAD-dependent 5-carboxymethylaminomethyl-2-thiouridine(34) oxidoreductase MnmC n=1 Tax=Ottowia thiooxydans TaxID=219182 RepID=UPI000424EFA3|nr:FAD-dependent 5-carboxymethylaminomethyl-2-thiouridine(34) oxidoreductase MnmC [Ottowia thiooxydans]